MSGRRTASGRGPTATATFGSGRRESHDATAFYARFVAPDVSDDERVAPPSALDVIHLADARDMAAVADASVALVVTPPYFAGKAYEEDLTREGVPSSYLEYLELLHAVFAECVRALEPGGRIAVNVANLGRKPYRSLSADVTRILEDLGLLLRGEVIWWKGRAAGGSCAWGTFQQPANPVLRDVTERIVIASKGRFDRAITPQKRLANGLPAVGTATKDEFMEATTDLWELAPESATRVGHPAPFPVELPQRCIELYTYEGDLVLDPFMGSGSTAVAAVRTGRHFVGFDLDPEYVATAEARIAAERARPDDGSRPAVRLRPRGEEEPPPADPVVAALASGAAAKEVAEAALRAAGFADLTPKGFRPRATGIDLTFGAADTTGQRWAFEVVGGFTTGAGGLRRSDALWRTIAKAAVLHESPHAVPLVVLATELPAKGTPAAQSLRAVVGPGRPIVDVVALDDADGRARLAAYAASGPPSA